MRKATINTITKNSKWKKNMSKILSKEDYRKIKFATPRMNLNQTTNLNNLDKMSSTRSSSSSTNSSSTKNSKLKANSISSNLNHSPKVLPSSKTLTNPKKWKFIDTGMSFFWIYCPIRLTSTLFFAFKLLKI